MNSSYRQSKWFHYALLHVVVFTWGWTGILGKLIDMPVLPMICMRLLLTLAVLFPVMIFSKQTMRISLKDLGLLSGIGIIIALHWLFFYQTIKISNVSIAVICLSTSSLFNALAEPLIFKRKLLIYEIILAVLACFAIAYIFLNLEGASTGFAFGIISAFFSAMFTTMNGRISKRFNSLHLSIYELLGASIFLLIIIVLHPSYDINQLIPPENNLIHLLLLSVVCTAFPFVASSWVLKHISPFTMLLSINLEPVYTIILAFLIFGNEEKMNIHFYVGTCIILASVFINGWMKARKQLGSDPQ
jgi:drug/metabolite transporter (DMT)-like permease